MYEDMEPLFANPMLPLLAIALADEAFQDYSTFDEIEEIPPPEDGSLHHLRIKSEVLDVPFFQNVLSTGPTGKIQGAASFSNRTVAWVIVRGTKRTSVYMISGQRFSSEQMVFSVARNRFSRKC